MARRKAAAVGIGAAGDEPDPDDKPIDEPERGPATAVAAEPARVSVTVDTLVTRPDLGANTFTFVGAGELVPVGLENFPRVPA